MKNQVRLLFIIALLSFTSASLSAQRLIKSIDFENGSTFSHTDLNVSSNCGGCSTQEEAFSIVPDPAGGENMVSKLSLKSCGTCPDGYSMSDNRVEGFVLPYHERREVELGKTYLYQFSYYFPENFYDWQRDNGKDFVIVSQWNCWCSGSNCFGLSECPKSNPDRYCGNSGAGNHLTFNSGDYSYSMKFHVDEGDGGDCVTLSAPSSASSTKGSWDHHIMEIKWSGEKTGYIRWWINNELVAESSNFRTWWHGVAMPSWKLGAYMGGMKDGAWSGGDDKIEMYVDNLRLFEGVTGCNLCKDCNECDGSVFMEIPNAPDNLNVTKTTSYSITLNWNDNSNNEDGFEIQRKLGDNDFSSIFVTGENISNYIDVELLPDTEYTYRVAARNFLGLSEFSNVVSATTETSDGSVMITPASIEASMVLGKNDVDKLFDGNKYSYWLSSGEEPSLEIDLGMKMAISRVFISFTDGHLRVNSFQVLISDDKNDWQTVGSFQSSGYTQSLEGYEFDDIQCRYLKIVLTNTSLEENYMSGLEIWGLSTTSINAQPMPFVHFYPNPAKNLLNIEFDNNSDSLTMQLVSLQGKVILSKQITKQGSISISDVPPGLYFLKFQCASLNLIKSNKLIILP